MAILPIKIWGDPVLTRRATAVDRITAEEKRLIADMKATMEAADGIGLAAPQVGVSKRIFVFRQGEEVHALINPRIIRRAGEPKVGSEGCLSIPGVQAQVTRHTHVVLTGRNEKGKPVEIVCQDNEEQGRAATCVQHELDHLDGVLYIDKMEPETLSWLLEAVDEDGEEIIVLEETSLDEVKEAYRTRRLPPDVHLSDLVRRRMKKGSGIGG